MGSHRMLHDMLRAPFIGLDPGNAGTITIKRWGEVIPIVTAGAETRTLAQPTKAGLLCAIVLDTDGGDLTLTVTGGYNQAGSTSITFGDIKDIVVFYSIKYSVTSYMWVVLGYEGTGLTLAERTLTELIVTGTANVGSIILDQGAPTAVADGDTAITAAQLLTKILTMIASTARAPTVPTGTAMNGALAVGESVDWAFINLATGASTITLTGATGHTIVGYAAIAQNVTGLFRTRVSAANTAITYRIG